MSETLSFAQDLIRRPSVTPNDAGCMEQIVNKLKQCDFEPEWLNFADTQNIWLRRGSKAPLFVFLGHTDVVPPGPLDDWLSPPFEPQIRDGKLFGRGAADMKGGIAAFVTACHRFVTNNPQHRGSIALLITSDEEGIASNGTIKVIETLEARNEKIDWCLVGEPSSTKQVGDVIKIGRRGSLCGILKVHGVQGHVAYPQLAENPIHTVIPAIAALTEETWDHGNDRFPPTSFQISNVNAGTGAENIIPGHIEMMFNLRFSTELNDVSIKQRVHAILDRHKLNYEIDWRLSGHPFLTQKTGLIDVCVSAIKEISGNSAELSTDGGTSDGRFVAPTGAEVIELGPINETIHKVNEHVHVTQLDTLSRIYERILHQLLANPA